MIEVMSAFYCTLVFHIDWSGTSAAQLQSLSNTEQRAQSRKRDNNSYDKEECLTGAEAYVVLTLPCDILSVFL